MREGVYVCEIEGGCEFGCACVSVGVSVGECACVGESDCGCESE